MNYLNSLLENKIDPRLPGFFSGSIKKGYNLANELVKRETELQLPEAKITHGNIRHAYVDMLLKHEIINSNINLKMESNLVVPNGYSYLTFTSKNYIFTVNKTTKKSALPKIAKNRIFLSQLNNDIPIDRQMSIFDQNADEKINTKDEKNNIEDEKIYLMITYGGVGFNLEYVEIGIPDVGAKKWLYQKNITNSLSIVQPATDSEKYDLKLEFKNEVKQKLNKEQKNDGGTI